MRISRWAAASAAVALTIGVGIAGAAPASANQVWIQQVERASADAPCDIAAVEGDAAGWSDWGPSWAQWPNEGEGGWVCQRSITWAKDTPPSAGAGGGGGSAYPSAFCLLIESGPEVFGQFNGGYSLEGGSSGAPVYEDADCTTIDEGNYWLWYYVYAPAGYDPETLCLETWATAIDLTEMESDVWGCVND